MLTTFNHYDLNCFFFFLSINWFFFSYFREYAGSQFPMKSTGVIKVMEIYGIKQSEKCEMIIFKNNDGLNKGEFICHFECIKKS